MYNDFVIVGPGGADGDPAGVAGMSDVVAALTKIADSKAAFASRGDESGTHQAERALWAAAGVEPGGEWYRETGSGMGATLTVAAELPAYALTDRGTWISFQNRGDLAIGFEGDPALFNQYGVMLVNPEKHPHVKAEAGQAFIAAAASGAPAIPAGSLCGPTMTKSLYITSNRSTPDPSATNASSDVLAWTNTTSASPRRPVSSA
jgi:tungstate transport system substrate-binding protein